MVNINSDNYFNKIYPSTPKDVGNDKIKLGGHRAANAMAETSKSEITNSSSSITNSSAPAGNESGKVSQKMLNGKYLCPAGSQLVNLNGKQAINFPKGAIIKIVKMVKEDSPNIREENKEKLNKDKATLSDYSDFSTLFDPEEAEDMMIAHPNDPSLKKNESGNLINEESKENLNEIEVTFSEFSDLTTLSDPKEVAHPKDPSLKKHESGNLINEEFKENLSENEATDTASISNYMSIEESEDIFANEKEKLKAPFSITTEEKSLLNVEFDELTSVVLKGGRTVNNEESINEKAANKVIEPGRGKIEQKLNENGVRDIENKVKISLPGLDRIENNLEKINKFLEDSKGNFTMDDYTENTMQAAIDDLEFIIEILNDVEKSVEGKIKILENRIQILESSSKEIEEMGENKTKGDKFTQDTIQETCEQLREIINNLKL